MDTQPLVSSRARTTRWMCAAAAVFEGFDNQSMGVAAPRVFAEFGLTAAQASLIFSAATVGLFLGATVGGRLADHIGRKRMLVISMLLLGTCSLLTSIAGDEHSLFIARLLTGLGLGGAMPNFISLSSEAVNPTRRLSSVTAVMAAMPCGGALAGLMALGDGFGWGWRPIFYVGGMTPIVLGLIMWRFLPESEVFAGRLEPDAKPRSETRIEGVATVLFGADRTSTTLLLWGGFFFTQLVLLLILNWLPSLLVGLGFTYREAILASVCFGLSGSVGAIGLARLHAGPNRRLWAAATYAAIAAALSSLTVIGKNFGQALLASASAGVFTIGAQLILFALAPLYYSRRMQGTGVGAAVAIGRLGSVFGPLYAGALLTSGGNSATVLLGILPFVTIAGAASLALTWRKSY